jgi:hypothetical protein
MSGLRSVEILMFKAAWPNSGPSCVPRPRFAREYKSARDSARDDRVAVGGGGNWDVNRASGLQGTIALEPRIIQRQVETMKTKPPARHGGARRMAEADRGDTRLEAV